MNRMNLKYLVDEAILTVS